MKKIISFILLLNILLLCSCSPENPNQMVYDDISKIKGLTREDHQNYTIFKFDNFEGKAVLKMDRVELEKGKIYYQYNLSKGHVYVNVDQGIYDSEQGLVFAVAGVTIPANSSSGFSINGDEIAIIFFTKGVNMNDSTKVSGEIKISFVPFDEIK